MVINNTPFEEYRFEGKNIYVKREDLCCPDPGPSFSKIRGVQRHVVDRLDGLFSPGSLGVVDTVHSKAGWGVSWIGKMLGIPVKVYYPYRKSEGIDHVRPYQKRCVDLGAEIIPLPATKSAVLYYQARKLFNIQDPTGLFLPNGLQLSESISETKDELVRTVKEEYLDPDVAWIVSISSATIGIGVAAGLMEMGFTGTLIFHMGYSRSEAQVERYLRKHVPFLPFQLEIVDEGYEYKDSVSISAPFPCNPFYDRKAWKYLIENFEEGKFVFWNIGA